MKKIETLNFNQAYATENTQISPRVGWMLIIGCAALVVLFASAFLWSSLGSYCNVIHCNGIEGLDHPWWSQFSK